MPTYTARCEQCGGVQEFVSSIADRHANTPVCVGCGKGMTFYIGHAPYGFVTGKFESFKSPVDGSIITNQRELKEHNTRNQVVNIQDGYSEERVLAGDYLKPEQLDPRQRKQDIVDAIHKVEAGYKPIIGAYDE